MNRLLFLASLTLALSTTTGCATMFNGTHHDLEVTSTPVPATFRVVTAGGGLTSSVGIDVATGRTPAKIEINKKSDYIVHVKAEGFEEAKVPLQRTFNGWTVCSLLCGLLPAGIDLLTGGMWDLEPGRVLVTLRPVATPPAAPGTTPAAPPVQPGALPPPPPPPPGTPGMTQGSEPRMYLFVFRKDDDGQLRYLAVPLVPETA